MPRRLLTLVLTLLCGILCAPALAQDVQEPSPLDPFEGRPIFEVVLRVPDDGGFRPLDPRREALARNQIGARPGAELRRQVIEDDLSKLNRLGEFGSIQVGVELVEQGWVRLIYTVSPQPKILAVAFAGNDEISDQDLLEIAGRLQGAPVSEEAIQQVARELENFYRSKGFNQVQVSPITDDLEDTGTLYFQVIEGLRLRITGVRFTGNSAFGARELRTAIKTRQRDTFGLLEKGRLDTYQVDLDTASLARYYKDRGYLEARVARRFIYAPNGREVIVEFIIKEGPRYTVRHISVEFEDVVGDVSRFSEAQVRGLIPLKTGDVYSERRLDESVEAVYAAYVELGHIDCRVTEALFPDTVDPLVDIELRVQEGPRFRTGEVLIQGNDVTRMEVILRETQLRPGRWLSGHLVRQVPGSAKDETERRLEATRLFGPQGRPDVRVTIQNPDPAEPEYRDVLVEVEETNTGSIGFGAQVSSDLGLFGRVSLTQRNFDITDTPDSLGELFTGGAFRGAGQTAELILQPGTEYQEYLARFVEPHLMETNYSLSLTALYRQREYRDFDEVRYGGRFGLGRRFGSRWRGSLRLRAEQVGIFDIDADAPTDFFDTQGYNPLLGIGVDLTRETFDDPFRPSRGTRIGLEAEQVFSDDQSFQKLGAVHLAYITLREDAVGSRTVLSLRTRADWIPQDQADVPFYERYSQGGSGFRGFGVRGIGPVGVRNDTGEPGSDQVGGVWSFFWGPEVQQPLFSENFAVALFVDTGTVEEEVTFDNYRVSVGFGFRIYIPQLSPVPLALDFGFPILKEDTDEERLFTFTADIPF
ncbi:MAG: outer membrane protein assembly factor BamA [Phycisphaerales bacterium JB039]